MPLIKELDASMTMYCQSDKKKLLIAIATEQRMSYSKLLLSIVDEWLEKRESNGRTD